MSSLLSVESAEHFFKMAVYYNWTDTLTFPMDQAECKTKCDVTQTLLKGD